MGFLDYAQTSRCFPQSNARTRNALATSSGLSYAASDDGRAEAALIARSGAEVLLFDLLKNVETRAGVFDGRGFVSTLSADDAAKPPAVG